MISAVVSRKLHIFLTSIAVALVIILPSLSSLAFTEFSDQEIDNMSSQTTVLLAQALKKGQLEAGETLTLNGSGVIIAHSGKDYYVVTNTHVLKNKELERHWGIHTADGEVHPVIEGNDNVIRFGHFLNDEVPTPGFDLAIIKFTSSHYPPYAVAVTGDSSKLQLNDKVFISGWPNPKNLEERSRKREFAVGNIAKISDSPDTNNGGYNIMYSNSTSPGMSGSPVFNSQGELVGIHGRGRRKSNLYCVDSELNLNNSCGIQVVHLINEIKKANIALTFNPPPLDRSVIIQGSKNRAKADYIEDVYKAFSNINFRNGDCSLSVLIDQPDCK